MYNYLQKYCLIINPNININLEILKNPGLIFIFFGGLFFFLSQQKYKLLSNPNLNQSDVRLVNQERGRGAGKDFLFKEMFLYV